MRNRSSRSREDEFDDYRWMQQGLSRRFEAAKIPCGNVIVYGTVALYPVVRHGEVLRGLRDLEARIVLGFPREERGGKPQFMNRTPAPTTWPLGCSHAEGRDDAIEEESLHVTTIRETIKRDIDVTVEPKMTPQQMKEALHRRQAAEPVRDIAREIARDLDVSPRTILRLTTGPRSP
jgi:hypothetical protein